MPLLSQLPKGGPRVWIVSLEPAASIALFLLTVLFVVGVYDVLAALKEPPAVTVSFYLQVWSAKWPFLPFMAGFVAGHLWFPLR